MVSSRRTILTLLAITGPLCLAAGCAEPRPASDVTFERGAQMLAAGSPKSAIPFFSQVIVTEPDGPEPHALLAMAYALNLQPDLAIAEASRVRRNVERDGPPSWEHIALGVAALVQRRGEDAVGHFKDAISFNPNFTGAGLAAQQWLALALLTRGEPRAAVAQLDKMIAAESASPTLRQTARLWSVIAHGYLDESAAAADDLAAVAKFLLGHRRTDRLRQLDVAQADLLDLRDAALLAICDRDFARARQLFFALDQRHPNACDAASWLALIAAADGQWSQSRDLLRAGLDRGPRNSQALANQLFSIVAACDGRADTLIEHMLAGQRLANQNRFPMQEPQEPKPDAVWFSDKVR